MSRGLATGETKFSVVVPLYNKERHVERALRSAIAQTRPPLEIVVVDDGSTDGGAAIVEAIAKEDGCVRLIRQPNGGVARARNAGIAASRGSHIAFLDADDEWLPTHLEVLARLVARFPECGLFSTGYRVIRSGNEARRASRSALPARGRDRVMLNYFRAALFGSPVWTSAAAAPRRTLDETGAFLPGAPRGEDLELWARISLRSEIAIARDVTALYHADSDNPSSSQASRSRQPGSGTRWWVIDRLEEWQRDSTVDSRKRRWIREWIAYCELMGTIKRDGSVDVEKWREMSRKHFLSIAFPYVLTIRAWRRMKRK